MKHSTKLIVSSLLMGLSQITIAADHGQHDSMNTMNHEQSGMSDSEHGGMNNMFLEKRTIDGYEVSFHVMPSNDTAKSGGSHNFMIKVEKGGEALQDVVVNTKVINPMEKSESKPAKRMGSWYSAGYDMDHKGKYQLMVLFKTADGEKHKGGVYYPAR